jgi:hypothetical protein
MINRTEPFILLGPKTFWWKVRLFFWSWFWFTSESPTRKTWEEFKYGLIKHKCKFDGPIFIGEHGYRFVECSHFGCNIVHDPDLDDWLEERKTKGNNG